MITVKLQYYIKPKQIVNVVKLTIRYVIRISICMLGNFKDFCRLQTFFNIVFSQYSFGNNIKLSNSFDPGQARRSIGPDLGLNCLQRS